MAASFAREGGGLKVKSAGAADFSLRGDAEGFAVSEEKGTACWADMMVVRGESQLKRRRVFLQVKAR